MPEVTLLRVEISEPVEESESSLGSKKSSKSSSLAAGAAGGAIVSSSGKFLFGSTPEDMSEFLKTGIDGSRATTRGSRRIARRLAITNANPAQYGRNISSISAESIKIGTRITGAATTAGAAAYSVYSDFQQTGLELSGSTHAAAIQQRKGQMANELAGLGVAVMINPVLAAPVIAMKAWQLSQTNRKELFEMRKSQITSEVLQRNLVKNVAERRF